MNVDAVQLATNFATLDVQPFELRYSQKLSTISSQTSAINRIKSALQKLDDQAYEFTKFGATLMQKATTTSSDDYLSVTTGSSVTDLDLDIFVHKLAQNHQMMVDVSSTDPSDVMASDGSFTVTNTKSGDAQSINIMDADSDASGDVTYSEFVTYFNGQFEDSMQAVIVKSQGAMKVLFSAVSEGEEKTSVYRVMRPVIGERRMSRLLLWCSQGKMRKFPLVEKRALYSRIIATRLKIWSQVSMSR
ncbi:flagellar hook-associated protein fliD [Vibrio variabilis]|uniref:Filament cap protein n=1 Tax=Vibrio variabilis TaxID=990271 RepID=A0ABQ0JFJ9_9VIBR|nr:flagellar hook-associated protein fliD [Vibrio variabilis]